MIPSLWPHHVCNHIKNALKTDFFPKSLARNFHDSVTRAYSPWSAQDLILWVRRRDNAGWCMTSSVQPSRWTPLSRLHTFASAPSSRWATCAGGTPICISKTGKAWWEADAIFFKRRQPQFCLGLELSSVDSSVATCCACAGKEYEIGLFCQERCLGKTTNLYHGKAYSKIMRRRTPACCERHCGGSPVMSRVVRVSAHVT